MTPPTSPARTFARNDGFGRPASALTIASPGGAAAALSAGESRSSSALEAKTRRRIEEVEPRRVDGETERAARPGSSLRLDACGADCAVGEEQRLLAASGLPHL